MPLHFHLHLHTHISRSLFFSTFSSVCVFVSRLFSPFLSLCAFGSWFQRHDATRPFAAVVVTPLMNNERRRTTNGDEQRTNEEANTEPRAADSGQRTEKRRTQNADRTRHNEQPNTELMMALCGAQWQMPNWRQVFTIAKKKFFTRCALSHTLSPSLSCCCSFFCWR